MVAIVLNVGTLRLYDIKPFSPNGSAPSMDGSAPNVRSDVDRQFSHTSECSDSESRNGVAEAIVLFFPLM